MLEKLVSLARDRTPAGRTVLFDRVAGLLLESEKELPAGATVLIDQILTGLLHEVEADAMAARLMGTVIPLGGL